MARRVVKNSDALNRCGDCARFEPYTDRLRLSYCGEVFWGYCPVVKLAVLCRDFACKEWKKGSDVSPNPSKKGEN